jgi:hypothetical protein
VQRHDVLAPGAERQYATPSAVADRQSRLVSAPVTSPDPPATSTWRPIGSWSGNGAKNTETFTVNAREWRLVWEASGDGRVAGIMQVFAYKGDSELPEVPVNTQLEGSAAKRDVSYLRGAGPWHMTINAMGEWRLRAEER